jgi:FixJ family two-component response regulator
MNQDEFYKAFDRLKGQRKNVLMMLIDGKTDKQIAESLGIEQARSGNILSRTAITLISIKIFEMNATQGGMN